MPITQTNHLRIIRRALGGLATTLACAILLCGWIWVRSYHYSDGLAGFGRGFGVWIQTLNGSLEFAVSQNNLKPIDDKLSAGLVRGTDASWLTHRKNLTAREVTWREFNFAGFEFQLGRPDLTYGSNGRWIPVALRVPIWFVILVLFGIWRLTKHQYRMMVQAERRAAGLCPACGYDLRATPNRCPECGSQVVRWIEQIAVAGRLFYMGAVA